MNYWVSIRGPHTNRSAFGTDDHKVASPTDVETNTNGDVLIRTTNRRGSVVVIYPKGEVYKVTIGRIPPRIESR